MDNQHDHLSEQAVDALRRMAGGFWSGPLVPGEIQIMRTHLPDHVVVGIARQNHGPIWILMDCDRPDTGRHLRELLAHWPAGVDSDLTEVTRHLADALNGRALALDGEESVAT